MTKPRISNFGENNVFNCSLVTSKSEFALTKLCRPNTKFVCQFAKMFCILDHVTNINCNLANMTAINDLMLS